MSISNRLFHVNLKMEITPPDDTTTCWTIMFPEVNVGSQGETPEEAVNNALEALQAWLEVHSDYGTLEDALKRHGIDQGRVHAIEQNFRTWFVPSSDQGNARCRA